MHLFVAYCQIFEMLMAYCGQTVTIKADFTCSLSFGIKPLFTDYLIEVPVNNNGHEPPILLARRAPIITPASPIDQFTVQVSLCLTFIHYFSC